MMLYSSPEIRTLVQQVHVVPLHICGLWFTFEEIVV